MSGELSLHLKRRGVTTAPLTKRRIDNPMNEKNDNLDLVEWRSLDPKARKTHLAAQGKRSLAVLMEQIQEDFEYFLYNKGLLGLSYLAHPRYSHRYQLLRIGYYTFAPRGRYIVKGARDRYDRQHATRRFKLMSDDHTPLPLEAMIPAWHAFRKELFQQIEQDIRRYVAAVSEDFIIPRDPSDFPELDQVLVVDGPEGELRLLSNPDGSVNWNSTYSMRKIP